MIALLVGILTGFLMCIPIGPINVWVININLKKSKAEALSIALGGSVMDLIYFLIILNGLNLFNFSESLIFNLKLIGIILIFIIGIKELFTKSNPTAIQERKATKKGIIGFFILGVIIYTSNPTLILTMTGLGAFIKSLELFQMTLLNISLVSTGLALGSFLWFFVLVEFVEKYKEKIINKYLSYFSRISGGLMIGLSLFMGHQLYF